MHYCVKNAADTSVSNNGSRQSTIINLVKRKLYAFVTGVGGLRFKSHVGQIGDSVANGSPPRVACWRNDAEVGLAKSLHALR